MAFRPSTAQREQIDRLLKKLELQTRNVCLMHRPVFEAAGIWTSADLDRPLASTLDRLSGGQASALITALQARIGESA